MDMLEALKPLLKDAIVRKYNSGATVLYQGEVPRFGCIVKSGIVKAFNISSHGEEQIVSFHIAGEVFPIDWIFGKTSSTVYFYEATGEAEVYLISRDKIKKFLTDNSQAQGAVLEHYVTNYTSLLLRICALEQAKAGEKIMYTLYYLCGRYGARTTNKHTHIKLHLTHQHIANLVGLTRETAATELNKLKRKNIIKYDSQNYTIDTEKLLEAMGEESFKGINLQ